MSTLPKTVIVGADGFIGRHLLAAYCHERPDTLGTTRRAPGATAFLDLAAPDVGPLRLRERGYEAAILTAAVTGVEACERDPAGSRRVNVTGTLALIRQLQTIGVLPVFLSSDYVFAGDCSDGYDDLARPSPLNEYGRQKAAVEAALRASEQPYLAIRPGKVFGLQKGDGTLLDEMASRLTAGLPVLAARDQILCPVWAEDVVRGIQEVQRRGLRGVVNLCPERAWSRYELALEVARTVNAPAEQVRPISLDELPGLARRPKCTKLIPDRLKRETAFRFTPLEACLRELARVYGHE
jgi:dTDP-4-dehydrorhamnose reductase